MYFYFSGKKCRCCLCLQLSLQGVGRGGGSGGWGGAWLHEQGGVADAPRRLERLGHRLLLGTAPVLLGGILCVLQNV